MAKPKSEGKGVNPKEGYRLLSRGFRPGDICDPDHDGDGMDYGSSYEFNTDGQRVYRPDED